MFQRSWRLKLLAAGLLISIGLGLVFGPSMWNRLFMPTPRPDSAHAVTPHPLRIISIPKAQDLFEPFLLTIPLHTTVIWQNNDTLKHVVITTSQKSGFLNPQTFKFHIPAGQQSHMIFDRAGLYHYYDTTVSSWNKTFSRVTARPGTPRYPLAMDGVI